MRDSVSRKNSRRGSIPSDLGDLIDELRDVKRRLKAIETPSSETRSATVPKLQALVEDLEERIDEYLAGRYTNEQLYTKSEVDALIAAAFAGDVAITGSLTVNGALVAASLGTAGALTVGGAVVMPNVYATDITTESGDRFTVWVRADGRVGHT